MAKMKLGYLSMALIISTMFIPLINTLGINLSSAQNILSTFPIKDFVNSLPDNNRTLGVNVTPLYESLASRKVNVLYESNETLILRVQSPWWDLAGHAIDFAKEREFNIDSVTVFSRQSNGTTWFVPDYYTIFMSKHSLGLPRDSSR